MIPLDPAVQQSIEQALVERDIGRAADIAERALGAGQRDPMLLNLVAWKLEEAGDYRRIARAAERGAGAGRPAIPTSSARSAQCCASRAS